MDYLTLKALHVIFIVTWFAGLFYLPRLFIYQTEALNSQKSAKEAIAEQLGIMSRRLLYAITWPSAIITLVFGCWLLYQNTAWLSFPFMHIKLTLVFVLYLYHFSLQYIYSLLQKGEIRFTSNQLRIWNELPTIVLIAVVFLIIKKDQLSWIWGTVGILGVALLLMYSIKIYKKIREKNG